jgi:hypothetical protein
MKKEAANSSENSEPIYQTILRHMPQDRNLDTAVKTPELIQYYYTR